MTISPTAATLEGFLAQIDSYPRDELAQLLRLSPTARGATPEEWRQSGRIFAFIHHGQWRYPKFQFIALQPRPILADLLHALPIDANGYETALFFVLPNAYLEDRAPMAALDIDPEKLRRVAHRYANPAECF
jgi:hypothetical protein